MRSSTARKRATNLSLDVDLVNAAREFNINVSEACERGLADEVKSAREKKWLEINMPMLDAWNDWVRENGMPYAEYRDF